ncbi:GGDEF domain-containing protein [bacterium]|nr:GGDEF domain-containing protein [bacterium]
MTDFETDELKKFIALEVFSDTSLLAVSAIDLSTYTVIYSNQSMKDLMANNSGLNCWESIHGQNSRCSWCKAQELMEGNETEALPDNNGYISYEHFNEVANKWFQIQDKIIKYKDGRDIMISLALDISLQKEAQSKFISTHVKLVQQTQALKSAQKKLKEQAHRDPLTNMYNRRYFADMSEKIIAYAKREKEPVSLIMLDIDDFKKINDTYGHTTGDEIIKLLSERLNLLSRESDITARFGGEEFAMILPKTDLKNALKFAEKIRHDIEKVEYTSTNETIRFTISIGVDEFKKDQDRAIDTSINRADKALYKAKESGKNRVFAST